MATFEAYEVALELVRAMRPVVETVARHDRDLAIQMRRATSSVPQNIAEGSQRAGKDRLHHYRVAAGSAAEVASTLRIAAAWGYIGEAPAAAKLADRVGAMLWRLTHPRR
jgi:four helix bundle protein